MLKRKYIAFVRFSEIQHSKNLKAINYFPDNEIKEYAQAHMVGLSGDKYDHASLYVKMRMYFISHFKRVIISDVSKDMCMSKGC